MITILEYLEGIDRAAFRHTLDKLGAPQSRLTSKVRNLKEAPPFGRVSQPSFI